MHGKPEKNADRRVKALEERVIALGWKFSVLQ